MPPPPPQVAYAVVVALAIWIGGYLRRDDLDAGERVYLAVVGLLAAVAIMIHPFRIPTTGQIVIAASWSPPTYLDPGASPSLTQELLVQLHRENPELIPAADLWEKSITRQASFSGPLFSFWCAAVSLACSAGWYFIPRWLNRLFYPPRRSRYEDDSAK